jgi:hypothetical protein
MQRDEKCGVRANAMIAILRRGSVLNFGYFKHAKSKERRLGGTFFLPYQAHLRGVFIFAAKLTFVQSLFRCIS